MHFEGRCHCGKLALVFDASKGLEELGLRACQCSFCRAHNTRMTSDPGGDMRFIVREPKLLSRYRFGFQTADFLICARCGVFIAAFMEEQELRLMTVNANTFVPRVPADFAVTPMDFDAEDRPQRTARRRQRWTPVSKFEE